MTLQTVIGLFVFVVKSILLFIIVACSEEPVKPLYTKPTLPEYVVGLISNEKTNITFEYTQTSTNSCIKISQDTSQVDLYFFGESQYGGSPAFSLDFLLDDRNNRPHDVRLWLTYYNSDTHFDMYGVQTRGIPVKMSTSNFYLDRDAKEMSFDFVIRIDPDSSNLGMVTTISGAIRTKLL